MGILNNSSTCWFNGLVAITMTTTKCNAIIMLHNKLMRPSGNTWKRLSTCRDVIASPYTMKVGMTTTRKVKPTAEMVKIIAVIATKEHCYPINETITISTGPQFTVLNHD